MGSFTLQLSVDDSNSKTKNANALKILIFMLYYVYYNTFEEPLNKHFFERMTNDPAEQKSISFNSLMGKLLLHINTNSKNTKKSDSTNDENSDENSVSYQLCVVSLQNFDCLYASLYFELFFRSFIPFFSQPYPKALF